MASLKTREWIGIIIILVLVQFMISYISFDVGTSGRALGYVSFAGTIVSIIIGVVAILYSFYQSNTQANIVNDIKDQAVRIVEAGDHIVKSKDSLFGSASQLMSLAGELTEKLQENNDHSAEFKNLLTKSLTADRVAPTQSNPLENDVFSTSYYYLDVCYLMIGEYIERNYTFKEFKEVFIIPIAEKCGLTSEFLEGSVKAIILLLESLNIVTGEVEEEGEQQKLSFASGKFKERIRNLARDIEDLKGKPEIVKIYMEVLAQTEE